MKAPPFDYVRANTLAEVFQLWREAGPEARLLAGGQSLIAALAFRLSEPSVLIDISRVADLSGISIKDGALYVGALTTHAELGANALVRQHAPLLGEAVPLIAHPAIRNRGTLGDRLPTPTRRRSCRPAALPLAQPSLRGAQPASGASPPRRSF